MWAVAVNVFVTVGLPASPNGPMLAGSANQVCGAITGSVNVTDGVVLAGPASTSGSPSNERSVTWSAGNGEISNSVGMLDVDDTVNESVCVGTPTAANGGRMSLLKTYGLFCTTKDWSVRVSPRASTK